MRSSLAARGERHYDTAHEALSDRVLRSSLAAQGERHKRALPLATRKLRVIALPPDQHAAVTGAVVLARQQALSRAAIASRLNGRT